MGIDFEFSGLFPVLKNGGMKGKSSYKNYEDYFAEVLDAAQIFGIVEFGLCCCVR